MNNWDVGVIWNANWDPNYHSQSCIWDVEAVFGMFVEVELFFWIVMYIFFISCHVLSLAIIVLFVFIHLCCS